MPQSKTNQPVVQAVLEEVLSRVLDEKLVKFATKQDLEKNKIEILGQAKEYRNQIMDRFDSIVGDIADLKQENEIGTHQYRELKETVDDHEERLAKLEQKSLAT